MVLWHQPWVPVVEAEGDFIDSVWMRHHHVESVLRRIRALISLTEVIHQLESVLFQM